MLTQPPKNPEHDYQRLLQYRANEAISQSALKGVIGISKPKKDSTYLYQGNLIDTLLFTPHLFDYLYYVSDEDGTTFQYRLAAWMKEQFDDQTVDLKNIGDQFILDAYKAIDYQRTWTDKVKLKRRDSILQALNTLVFSQGKTIISRETKNVNQQLANRAVSFIQDKYSTYQDWSIHPQEDIYFTHSSNSCKALLDMYLMSPDARNIEIIPTDFKWTSYRLRDYYRQMRRLRIDLQAAFYTKALESRFPTAFIHNFEVIVYSSYDDAFEIFKLTDQDLSVGRYGMASTVEYFNGDQTIERRYETYGYEQALRLKDLNDREYLNHLSHNGNSIWF